MAAFGWFRLVSALAVFALAVFGLGCFSAPRKAFQGSPKLGRPCAHGKAQQKCRESPPV
jgi:hypothetical protein